MHVRQIAEGLWRWTSPHPSWEPGKTWPQEVGCVYFEPPGAGTIVLIDPLVPTDGARFWEALDRDVARTGGRPVAVLISNEFHGRSADAVRERYGQRPGCSVWVPAAGQGRVSCRATDSFEAGAKLPGGAVPYFIEGLVEPEVVFFLPHWRALVVADALLGDGAGRVRLPPLSWATPGVDGERRYHERFRASVRSLLDTDPEMLLISHGETVLSGARIAIAAAVDADPT